MKGADRIELDDLLEKQKKIKARINELTLDDKNVPYAKKLIHDIEAMINERFGYLQKYEAYRIYSKIRQEIHKKLQVNGKIMTQREYEIGISIAKDILGL